MLVMRLFTVEIISTILLFLSSFWMRGLILMTIGLRSAPPVFRVQLSSLKVFELLL